MNKNTTQTKKIITNKMIILVFKNKINKIQMIINLKINKI